MLRCRRTVRMQRTLNEYGVQSPKKPRSTETIDSQIAGSVRLCDSISGSSRAMLKEDMLSGGSKKKATRTSSVTRFRRHTQWCSLAVAVDSGFLRTY